MYVDDRENPETILRYDYDVLFNRLGLVAFQIERSGYYDPNLLLKADWGDKGREVYKKYASLVKSKICEFYTSMKESGVLNTMEKAYLVIFGLLLGIDIPRAIAAYVAAIIAKQGLYSLCKEG